MEYLPRTKIGPLILSATALTCALRASGGTADTFPDIMDTQQAVIATTEDINTIDMLLTPNIPSETPFEAPYCPDHTRIDYDNPAVQRIMELPTYEEAFLETLEIVCCNLDMHAHALLAVIHAETGGTFDPSLRNPGSRATGLIQFTPQTARRLGTSIYRIRQMGQIEQLDLIEEYYRRVGQRNGPDIYHEPIAVAMAVFMPNSLGRSWNHVVVDSAKHPTRYALNRAIDLNDDGRITVTERARRAFKFGYTTEAEVYPWVRRRMRRQQRR